MASDFSSIPQSAQTDLCVMAILCAAEAMKTPEGRAAIENGKKEYLRHLAEIERSNAAKESTSTKKGGSSEESNQKGARMKTKKVPPPVCKTGDGGGTNDMITRKQDTIPTIVCQAEVAYG